MGIRKSLGKNKKSKKPAAAIAVRREETVRRSRVKGPRAPRSS